jgi:hypothetical protein
MTVIYQNDILTTLAYLMGEKSVNTSTSAPRSDFIQSALSDIYGAYPWIFARANATLTLSNGMATLPTTYDPRHTSYGKFTSGTTDIRLNGISDFDNGDAQPGDRVMWIEPIDGGDGTRFGVHVKDTDVTTVLVRYQKSEPLLDSAGTVGTPYPNKRTIALGARIYVKSGQNPDADVSQEDSQFQDALKKDIARFQVQEPRRRRRTAQGQVGAATGEF